jgi:lipoyl(octanoyl) transferase
MSLVSTTKTSQTHTSGTLEVHLLGVVDFDSAVFLQERLVYEISGRSDTQGGLLLCEHPPLITVGRQGSHAHILADQHELESRQIDVRWLNRGGGCILHAPGQLAVYPIVPLDRLKMGLAEYRRRLEQSVIDLCRELRVPAFRQPNGPGVWCRCGRFTELGIAVRSWVTFHGLFINVSPSTELLRLVGTSCDGKNERSTSLATQRHRLTSMHVVREGIIRHLTANLGYEKFHLYTGHPLLKRTTRKFHVHA